MASTTKSSDPKPNCPAASAGGEAGTAAGSVPTWGVGAEAVNEGLSLPDEYGCWSAAPEEARAAELGSFSKEPAFRTDNLTETTLAGRL